MRKPAPRTARLIFWGTATAAIMIAVFFFSSQPADESSSLSEFFLNTALGRLIIKLLPSFSGQEDSHVIRKFAHAFEFFCLGASACQLFLEALAGRPKARRRSLYITWPFCLLYACSDEIHQIFVEGRSCQLADVGVDCIGFSLGITLSFAAAMLISHSHRRRSVNDNG